MQQIFISNDKKQDDTVLIEGQDAMHLSKVLRMRPGEKIRISTESGESFIGELTELSKDSVKAKILEKAYETELSNKIYLFQALPKGDRMETVIEKAVELGVTEIIPVQMKYCVAKPDEKKKENRLKRYQAIAESAAKQSKRSVIPKVKEFMNFKEAADLALSMDICLVPYENKEGMGPTGDALKKVTPGKTISVVIGPEGGFAGEEIEYFEGKADIVSLGRRILRTDTAAITALSLIMLQSELA